MKLKIAVLSNEFTQTLLEAPFLKKETFQSDFDDYVCSSKESYPCSLISRRP